MKIIAEIGINHDGSFQVAKDLIKESKLNNVDAIKFQYRNLNSTYFLSAKREIGDEILISEIKKNYLSPSEILELTLYAKNIGLEVGISFFNIADIKDFQQNIFNFDFFKLPSAELLNYKLAADLLNLGKHLYISTGAHSENEVIHSLKLLPKNGWTPLHCISNYPSKKENAKLGYIQHLKDTWQREVGYSSHDDEWEVCLLALSLGATTIERHITLDKKSKGLDHSSSSTPDEFYKLTSFAKKMSKIIAGNNLRVPNQGEKLNKQNLGRSYFFNKSMKSGEVIERHHLEYKSPFVGVGVQEVDNFIGKQIGQNCKMGDVLSPSLLSGKIILPKQKVDFVNRNHISLPVRFHDYDLISELFPIDSFELHLSYQETLGIKDTKFIKKNHQYSIHLPDYINENELINPFSMDESQRKLSFLIINKIADLSLEIQNKTGKKVPVVGSFSIVETTKEIFYEKLKGLSDEYSLKEVCLLPQWLPPIAWYFGGSVSLNSMCDITDAEYLEKFNIPICMDFCHFFMGREYYGFSVEKLLEKVKPLIKHIHLADSIGFDGEGVQFGEGEPENLSIINNYINAECLKVIEVWQGHHNQGMGFREAINKLEELYG